jgi:UDP-N-acetylmuramoyl-tripeptide--D-alanyl-D-alanine ligase
MSFWTPENLRSVTSGTWLIRPPRLEVPPDRPADLPPPPAHAPITGLSTDTREIKPGQAFLALRGENHDAHRFLAQAVTAGATILIIDDETAIPAGGFTPAAGVLKVADTGKALLKIAAAYRESLKGTRVIAVCGSNGKTTTTRLIEQVLNTTFRGTASKKSFNNAVGVPLTILRAQPADQYLVCEVGTNAPGEIATLAAVVQPDIAVITSIGREHLEGLGDLAGVAAEEATVLKFLRPKGCAIINADSPELDAAIRKYKPTTLVRFGRGSKETPADIRLGAAGVTHIDESGPSGQSFTGIGFAINDRFKVRLPMLGEHNAMNALAAFAVGRRMAIEEGRILEALTGASGAEMRLQLTRVSIPAGGEARILNDAYNANPDSMLAALATLTSLRPGTASGRRVAILGDMFELGPTAAALHGQVIDRLAELGDSIGLAVLIGEQMCRAGAALSAAGWSDHRLLLLPAGDDAAIRTSAAAIQPHDVVLLKASRRMRLERVLSAIAAMHSMTPAPVAAAAS